jgi:hypothetical protein
VSCNIGYLETINKDIDDCEKKINLSNNIEGFAYELRDQITEDIEETTLKPLLKEKEEIISEI